jgi:hypothetical protein
MEAKLENILDNMMQNDGVSGVLIADNQGLSFGSKNEVKKQKLFNFKLITIDNNILQRKELLNLNQLES